MLPGASTGVPVIDIDGKIIVRNIRLMKKKKKADRYRRSQPKPRRNWFYANILLAVTLIIAGVGALLWMGQQSSGNAAQASDPAAGHQGNPAPAFTLQSLEGQAVSLDDYAGQVVLVNMWATWCPPCKAEMPDLNAFYETHKQDGFVVFAINSQEEAPTVKAFIAENGFSFPVLLDSQAEVMKKYHVRGLPTTFIIDRDGFIQHIQSGQISTSQLEAMVGPLL
jgi:peroxiredoxin